MPDPTSGMPIADVDLEAALRDLAGSLAILGQNGAAELDPARRARLRIEQGDAGAQSWRRWAWLAPSPGRRVGRGIALALVAVVVVAAIAGAIGLGLPGIRIVPAPSASAAVETVTPSPGASGSPVSSASPTIASPLGASMGLGDPIAVGNAATSVDFPVRLPTAPGVGSPTSAWLQVGRLSLVWPAGGSLPATREPGVGLILSEFRGSIDSGYFQKVVGPDTKITAVSVDGVVGYWISGVPHEIVFVDVEGNPVFDSRRIVGDTLLWARGDVTYRLESGLDRAASIALANGLR
jgi:hypothetical protein